MAEKDDMTWKDWLKALVGLSCVVLMFGVPAFREIWDTMSHGGWVLLVKSGGLLAAASVALNILLNAFSNSDGYRTAANYEWRYVTKSGAVGAPARSATIRDVYEKQHGYGSWQTKERKRKDWISTLRVLGGLGAIIISLSYIAFPPFGPQPFGAKILILGILCALSVLLTLLVGKR